jgi:hypothetical protein
VLAVLGGLSIAVFSAPNKLAPVKAVTVGGVGSVTPVSPVETAPQH